MDALELFAFDSQGWLVVRGALTADEVSSLNAAVDAQLTARHDDPNSVPGGGRLATGQPREHLTGMLGWSAPLCDPFRALLTHTALVSRLNTVLGKGWRMDHAPFVMLSDRGAEGLVMHGSGGAVGQPETGYVSRGGVIRCGLVTVEVALSDQIEGDGGFAVISGSHKTDFPCPRDVVEGRTGRELIANPTIRSGDVLFFTEAVWHGTLPWTADRQRRALFLRFVPKHMHFAGGYATRQLPGWADELTPAQRSVLEPPYVYERAHLSDDGSLVPATPRA
jgi:hypothetical protein